MSKLRVAVVFGGRSGEHAISCVSAGNVLRALDRDRYDVLPVGITPAGKWVLAADDPSALEIRAGRLPTVGDGAAVVLSGDPAAHGLIVLDPSAGARAFDGVDVVFPVLHGPMGEDGTIQGLLEMAGVPYVGAGVFASAAGMDKEFSNKLMAAEGLPVGRYAVLRPPAGLPAPEQDRSVLPAAERDRLGLPVFVKPARAGSSIGITKVVDWADLDAALAAAREIDPKVLVESAVPGREIECGVLDGVDGGPPEASVPGEIRVVSGHGWYDFEAKYLDDACEFDVPAVLSPELTAAVQEMACRAFTALECRGLARVDFFLTPEDELIVNEVNTMPGFTQISMFPRLWAASGLTYPALMDRLIAAALR